MIAAAAGDTGFPYPLLISLGIAMLTAGLVYLRCTSVRAADAAADRDSARPTKPQRARPISSSPASAATRSASLNAN
jgi:hypothetical protein